jgi:hypothetical protein
MQKRNNKDVLHHAKSVVEFNTNNGWGFGGAIGKRYFFRNGSKLTIANACYRHLPSQKFYQLSDASGRKLFDVDRMNAKLWDLVWEVTESNVVEK